jgi:antitoxin component of MazEF toxin-antitoxin module
VIKHLTRHGNSLALVIDRGVLDLLDIDVKTPLAVATDGTRLVITPVRDVARPRAADRSAAVYAGAVRAMTLEQKLRVSEGLRDLAWQVKARALARRHPEWTAEELDRRVGEAFLRGRS